MERPPRAEVVTPTLDQVRRSKRKESEMQRPTLVGFTAADRPVTRAPRMTCIPIAAFNR